MSENTTKQFLDKEGLSALWNKICTTIDETSPFAHGDKDNSAVLKGEYTVGTTTYSNKAVSQVSVSLGAATTAGLKGWYYSAISFGTNPVITLSDKQPSVLLNNLIGGSWSSGTPAINVGDKISIVNDSKYDYCGVVKSISGNKITLKAALPFDSLATSLISANDPDDWTIYLPERADAGIIDMGGGSLAEGVNTQATNIGAHAEGIQTHAYGQYSHTEGFQTKAGYAAHAEGGNTAAEGLRSHAEGWESTASGKNSHAEGRETIASGENAHAEGMESEATGKTSHTEGYQTKATKDSSHAEGWKTQATGVRSHAEGSETIASGKASHSGGIQSTASGEASFAHGVGVKTTNEAEHASGKYNKSISGSTLFSVGNGTSDTDRKNAFEITSDGNAYIGETIKDNKVATLKDIPTVDTELDELSNNPIANSTVVNAIKGGIKFAGVINSTSLPALSEPDIDEYVWGSWTDIDSGSVVNRKFYHGDIIILVNIPSIEYNPGLAPEEPTKEYILVITNEDAGWVPLGDISPAQEMIDASTLLVKGTGTGSVIVKDRGCIADGQYSTVFGRNGRAFGNYSYVEGRGQGDPSSITKDNAETSWDSAEATDGTGDNLHLGVGNYVHVEGFNNIAIGDCSHVEGQRNKAKGVSSHAEGWKTQAIGNRSHAEGQSTKANGNESHAGGVGSIATGARSFAHGNNVKTTHDDEVAFGKYNVSKDNTAFSIGIGASENNRKNAVEVYSDGQSRFAGMAHFDGDIHLCKRGSDEGGAIYFGDAIDDGNGHSNAYIKESDDDILDIYGSTGITIVGDSFVDIESDNTVKIKGTALSVDIEYPDIQYPDDMDDLGSTSINLDYADMKIHQDTFDYANMEVIQDVCSNRDIRFGNSIRAIIDDTNIDTVNGITVNTYKMYITGEEAERTELNITPDKGVSLTTGYNREAEYSKTNFSIDDRSMTFQLQSEVNTNKDNEYIQYSDNTFTVNSNGAFFNNAKLASEQYVKNYVHSSIATVTDINDMFNDIFPGFNFGETGGNSGNESDGEYYPDSM